MCEAAQGLAFEQEAWNQGLLFVAGVDEAGRGPLAGPVVAAAVILNPALFTPPSNNPALFAGLTDSKQLTATKRDRFFDELNQCDAVRIGCCIVGADVIDRINILQATWRAMAGAVQQLDPLPDLALVDGRPVRGLPCSSRNIIRGDSQSLSIAAASVIAKVTRDRLMDELDAEYPEYGFSKHKGYGTAVHLDALRRHGPCPQHRRSFRPVAATISIQPDLFTPADRRE